MKRIPLLLLIFAILSIAIAIKQFLVRDILFGTLSIIFSVLLATGGILKLKRNAEAEE